MTSPYCRQRIARLPGYRCIPNGQTAVKIGFGCQRHFSALAENLQIVSTQRADGSVENISRNNVESTTGSRAHGPLTYPIPEHPQAFYVCSCTSRFPTCRHSRTYAFYGSFIKEAVQVERLPALTPSLTARPRAAPRKVLSRHGLRLTFETARIRHPQKCG